MAKRIEVLLNKKVWPIAKKFESKYKNQELWLSAAVWVLNSLSAKDRDRAIDIANEFTEEQFPESADPAEAAASSFQHFVRAIERFDEKTYAVTFSFLEPRYRNALHALKQALSPAIPKKPKKKAR